MEMGKSMSILNAEVERKEIG